MTVRTFRTLGLVGIAGLGCTACTTTGGLPPAEVVRYHLNTPIDRGAIAVEPASGNASTGLEYKNYAAAVQTELLKLDYIPPPQGSTPQFVATVAFSQTAQAGPPRRSPISIGIGGGSFGGGRHGGVGLGGGVGFPIGAARARQILVTELGVTIKRRVDLSPVWEGRAHIATELRSPDSDAPVLAEKLARALFTGFPGVSGRTIEVK